jgi:hypothetical protein
MKKWPRAGSHSPRGMRNWQKLSGWISSGGLVVINAGLIYVADYGYKCIWKITVG